MAFIILLCVLLYHYCIFLCSRMNFLSSFCHEGLIFASANRWTAVDDQWLLTISGLSKKSCWSLFFWFTRRFWCLLGWTPLLYHWLPWRLRFRRSGCWPIQSTISVICWCWWSPGYAEHPETSEWPESCHRHRPRHFFGISGGDRECCQHIKIYKMN